MPDKEVTHYEGERGAKRMVRVVRANGNVQYYEGERGAERKVRAWCLSMAMSFLYYEGERVAEQIVPVVLASG